MLLREVAQTVETNQGKGQMSEDNLATNSSSPPRFRLMYLHGLWPSTNSGVHDSLREPLDQVVRTWRSSLDNLPTTLLKGALAFNIWH